MKRTYLILLVLLLVSPMLRSQTVPVKVSNVVQTRNGKEYYVYIAQQGQTVFSIARAYGLHYSVAVLRTDVQSMAPGDTVWLPVNAQSQAAVSMACGSVRAAEEPVKEIVVAQGQTLYSLSRQYGVTVEQLEQLNPDLKMGGLRAGQKLRIPASAAKSAKTVPSVPAKTAPLQTAKPQGTTVLNPRERISPDKVYVSVMMPLHLDKAGEISTTKFDVDQRGKKSYPSFEFIQFYEGVLMALEQLESRGINVVLNVVDVPSDDDATVVSAFNSHNVAHSDFVIALLTRKPFAKVAELAKENRVFVISPMSTRSEILFDNPYVVKYMPSDAAVAKSMLDVVSGSYPGSHLYVIHSKGPEEAGMYNAFDGQLKGRTDIKYTFFDWSQNGKLVSTLKSTRDNVVVSIYDRGREKNRIFSNLILNRLNAMGSLSPVLMTSENYVRDIADVDFNQLQNVNYHMLYTAYLHYDDPLHKDFIDRFKQHYQTEPQGVYAGMAYDIMLYFTSAIAQKGSGFWRCPSIQKPYGMLFPLHIAQESPTSGFENQAAVIYRMENFKLVNASSK